MSLYDTTDDLEGWTPATPAETLAFFACLVPGLALWGLGAWALAGCVGLR